MDARTIEQWIKNLGRPYDALVIENIIPDMPLQELYRGRDWLDIEPADGLELSFQAATMLLETLYITLVPAVPGQKVFGGELPAPFKAAMSRAEVRADFGQPLASKGPATLPLNRKTGGWDAYQLEPSVYPDTQVIIKYAQDTAVNTLVFTLMSAGH